MTGSLLARVRVFVEEFSFIGRYVAIDKIRERPTVQRVDLDLVNRQGWAGPHGNIRFLLIGEDGQELGEAKQNGFKRTQLWHPSTWLPQFIKGETVYEAVTRLTDPDKVVYILEVNEVLPRLVTITGLTSDHTFEATVHKVPSGQSFSDWLTHLREVATSELKDELTKVNEI